MSEENKKVWSLAVLVFYRKIFVYIKRYPKIYNSLIVVIILQALVYYLVPFLTKDIFDIAIPEKNYHLLLELSAGFIGILIILYITMYLYNFLASKLGNYITNDLRQKIHNKILLLTADEMRNFTSSDLIGKFSNHIAVIQLAMLQVYWGVVVGIMNILFPLLIMFYLDIPMTVFVIVFLVLSFILTIILSQHTKHYLPVKQKGEGKLLSMLTETLSLHIPIRLLGLGDFRDKKFNNVIEQTESAEVSYNFYNFMASTSMALGGISIRFGMIVLGAYLIFHNRLTIGTLIGFITFLNTLVAGMNVIANSMPLLMQAKDSFEKIEDILNIQPRMIINKKLPNLDELTKNVELKNVSFTYSTNEKPILKDINLEIGLQQSIAIVGTSGAGKSTLLNILLRELIPTAGEITSNNKNLLEYSVKSFLDQIGVVLQTPYAFEASILDNIKIRKPDATYDEVVAAAEQAGIHQEILKLEQGYNTIIGRDKVQVSVGQLQRIVIAQALLGNPLLLILDEPTASLDLISKEKVQKTLLKQKGRRAIIMVTHHLNEVAAMDKIFVMHEGQIVETGKHQELLNLDGYYARLWNKQNITIEKQGIKPQVNPDWLRNIPLFAGFSTEILAELAKEFVMEHFAVNQIILDEGDPGEEFYIIAKGKVEVSKFQPNNKEHKILAILENGDFFGELALLKSIPRTARVTALETCTMLVLNRKQLDSLLDKLSPVARADFDLKVSQRMNTTL